MLHDLTYMWGFEKVSWSRIVVVEQRENRNGESLIKEHKASIRTEEELAVTNFTVCGDHN